MGWNVITELLQSHIIVYEVVKTVVDNILIFLNILTYTEATEM